MILPEDTRGLTRPKIHLIDASIYIFKAYFGLPEHWHADDGMATECVFGFAKFLQGYLAEHKPEYLVCCFDESLGQGFRERLYEGYKARRALPDEALAFQLNACQTLSRLLGITNLASNCYEADDLIGSVAAQARALDFEVIIASRDKDLGQLLIDSQVRLWDGGEYTDRCAITERFAVQPEQLADYLALVGDSVDDIPGVPGIGAKTAAALLSSHDSIDELFSQLQSLQFLPIRGAKGLAQKLTEHRDQLQLMRQLTRIALDAPIPTLEACRLQPADAQLAQWLGAMGMPNDLIDQLAYARSI